MIDELFILDPKNLAVIGIGSEPTSEWKKYTHLVEMGSLNKCQTSDEFSSWCSKYIEKDDELFLTLKLDGLSISLIYENGILVNAATRGSGLIGELITANVVKMDGVPLRLTQKVNATIRGEILLSKENHKKYFSDYSNARNAASGISRRYDSVGSEHLSVLVYKLNCDEIDLKTQEDEFNKLIELGFKVPKFYIFKSIKDIEVIKAEYHLSLRDQYEFDLDGLVIHNNSLSKQMSHGSSSSKPRCSIAYKFDSVSKEAYISKVAIQVGNSGRITPVAVFNPKVNLMGADVERASLHNFTNIENLGIDIGCKVLVCRSNDVIPYVEEVSESTGTIFTKPTNCPVCNALLEEKGEYVQCPNTDGCLAQIVGRIENWVSDLNILELGVSLIEKLVHANLVKNPADLYLLTVEKLSNLDRMGDKSAQNVFNSIWKINPITLDVFLGGLSIPLIGSSSIRLLMEAGFDSLEKIRSMSQAEMEAIKGMGPARAESLVNGIIKNKDIIDQLLVNGIKIKDKIIGTLTNKKLCFTGTMATKRAILEQMVVDAGGSVKSSVSKGLDYLVSNADSNSSKSLAAKKLGITIITEGEFINMVK